jgi:MtN3 and saliva related transmembrane protein
MQLEQVIGIAAGILTGVSMLPQLVKLIKEKKGEAISPVMLTILISGLALWVYYGILKNDLPIIVTNAFSFVVNFTLLILRQIYKSRENR